MFNHFTEHLGRELSKIMVGKRIGWGISREVYELELNPDYVIKIELGDSFANVLEWTFWNDIKDTKLEKWFAPCLAISPNGVYLIQRKTKKPLEKDYPERVPTIFTDLKYDNYGVIIEKNKKRFVCHDYGNFSTTDGFKNTLKKAKWWSNHNSTCE